MDAAEQIKRFEDFLEANYKLEVLQNIQADKNFVIVDFTKLVGFDPELADELLEHPEEIIKAGEVAIRSFDIPDDKKVKVRLRNLPASQKVRIRDIRTSNLGKFVVVDGLVRQKSDVRPKVVMTRFECPSCGNVISIPQQD
jgi:replicative DNA helicase Mcm